MQTLLFTLLFILAVVEPTIAPVPQGGSRKEFQALIDFMIQFTSNLEEFHSWDPGTNPCTWRGILCRKGHIWGLKLENMGLKGPVRLEPIEKMVNVKTLSMMNNNLTGPFPNISLLPSIKSVYFSGNQMDGIIPPTSFSDSGNLKKLHLANNLLSGVIPDTLAKLTGLKELKLENNNFHGSIPDFKDVKLLNVSFNMLSGRIPRSLSQMSSSSFIGNQDICGQPTSTTCDDLGVGNTKKIGDLKYTYLAHVIAVLVTAIMLTAICALSFIVMRYKRRFRSETPLAVESPITPSAASGRGLRRTSGGSPPVTRIGVAEPGKLCFLKDEGGRRFELTDLLRASAEILGGGSMGSMGSSYKAAVLSGPVVVVKRYRQMNSVNKEEFHEHMRRIGSLDHPNLLSLVAYYYRREEKLLVTEFVQGGNLAFRLHGNVLPKLDWPTRLKIMKGIAKGLWYLYDHFSDLASPHGHLKSSNILLSHTTDPVLTDYALVPVVNHDHAHHILVAYHSPEFHRLKQITRKTDVWALGLIILEMLTGTQPPRNPGNEGDCLEFTAWVMSMRKAMSGSTDVLDRSMGRVCEGEMVKMLRIAMGCCEEDLGKRMDMKEVVERIEEVREYIDEFYSTRLTNEDCVI